MTAFYNEVDPFAAQWLRNLIDAGHIAPGIVDERSIEDITPEELHGFTQCHFFAGLGGWSYALRLAGWPDDEPVWTGSCPCQPFSTAGKGAGFNDERHLWPAFHYLIQHCQPPIVFGEQVASKDGRAWLGLVHADLEGVGYSVGAADLCAAGVGAPHIRQRLYWVAQSYEGQRGPRWPGSRKTSGPYVELAGRSEAGVLAHRYHPGLEIERVESARAEYETVERSGAAGELANANGQREGEESGVHGVARKSESPRVLPRANALHSGRPERWSGAGDGSSPWSGCAWIPCRDGKSRPIEPGTFPLAHGAPARVGRLRAYGNAIVPQVAEVFIRAAVEALELKEMMS